jgi:bacillolysin
VVKAVAATELSQQPPHCAATEAPVCASRQSPSDLFFDDLEDPGNPRWQAGQAVGAGVWYYPQTDNPYQFDFSYATSGRYNFWGDDPQARSDGWIGMIADAHLPAGSAPYLRFNHAYAFEKPASTAYDGGVLEYSTDHGASWNDAGALFTGNGYSGTIASVSTNPLKGRRAFVGRSNGYLSSRLDLSGLAGRDVRFRFRIGTDRVGGDWGWFVDDIRIYTCEGQGTTPTVTPTASRTATPTNTPTVTRTATPTGSPTMTATPSATAPIRARLYLPMLVRGGSSVSLTTPPATRGAADARATTAVATAP